MFLHTFCAFRFSPTLTMMHLSYASHNARTGRPGLGQPFPGAAIPSVRRYIHNAYATPYERSPY